jgi:hypothetical protein
MKAARAVAQTFAVAVVCVLCFASGRAYLWQNLANGIRPCTTSNSG